MESLFIYIDKLGEPLVVAAEEVVKLDSRVWRHLATVDPKAYLQGCWPAIRGSLRSSASKVRLGACRWARRSDLLSPIRPPVPARRSQQGCVCM